MGKHGHQAECAEEGSHRKLSKSRQLGKLAPLQQRLLGQRRQLKHLLGYAGCARASSMRNEFG
eukprot:1241080-Amphidinium_carterae.1